MTKTLSLVFLLFLVLCGCNTALHDNTQVYQRNLVTTQAYQERWPAFAPELSKREIEAKTLFEKAQESGSTRLQTIRTATASLAFGAVFNELQRLEQAEINLQAKLARTRKNDSGPGQNSNAKSLITSAEQTLADYEASMKKTIESEDESTIVSQVSEQRQTLEAMTRRFDG